MRVAVIGAGIVGVASAYELAADGHEVSVYERHAGVASEGSFAHAGIVAPGYATPWDAPGMPLRAWRQLCGAHAPVRLGGAGALGQLPWLWRRWRAARAGTSPSHRAALVALARFSRQRLHELTDLLELQYEQARGVLVLLRGERELAWARPALDRLAESRFEFELLDAAQCHRLEPGLNTATPLHAGISLPRDGVGNGRHFAQLLRVHAQHRGAHFRFGHEVHSLSAGTSPRLISTDLASGAAAEARFDAVLLCTSHASNRLLAPLRRALPLAPVYGHSITAPLQLGEHAATLGPRAAVMDEKFKVTITRLGQRIRVAGSTEIGGPAQRIHPSRLATLHKVLDDWFPGAARRAQTSVWKGARPMLPDGLPLLGAIGSSGIWLNLGHGSSGFALACGSARVIADLMAGHEPAIDVGGLQPRRVLV